jgi:hypothetical protein
MQDAASRPELADRAAMIEAYDRIYLGFPIWWYVAPHIINSFLEQYDFSGKTIIVFATSGGSDFGQTVEALRPSCAADVKWVKGEILNRAPSREKLQAFIDGLKS